MIPVRMTPNMKKTKQKLHKRLNWTAPRGVLGNSAKTDVEVPGKPGLFFAREWQAGGTLGAEKMYHMNTNANIALKIGQAVLFGYDERGEWVILKADGLGMEAAGENPSSTNPINPQLQFITQDKIITGLSTPNYPLDYTVLVKPWLFVANGILRYATGGVLDLSGLLPSAGEHCLATIFVLEDGSYDVIASTAKPTSNPITFADIQEALDLEPLSATPNWAWRLTGDMPYVAQEHSYLDLRGLFNIGMGDREQASREVDADATATTNDYLIKVNRASGAPTDITLPTTPLRKQHIIVKDKRGDASSNTITVIAGGSDTIDGDPDITITTDKGSVHLFWDLLEWTVI